MDPSSPLQNIQRLASLYKKAILTLQNYDKQNWPKYSSGLALRKITYEEIQEVIQQLRDNMKQWGPVSDLFGEERDGILKNIIDDIYQSFSGKELYPSTQEKAANLLYLLVKDHPFSDGNKKIAAFLFEYFLDLNDILKRANGELRISNEALVSLVLFIAESQPEEKDNIIKFIMHFL